MNWLIGRLKEPSSQLAVGAIVGAIVTLKDDPANATAWAGLLSGIAGFLTPEKSS